VERFYPGTKADLKQGELIEPGYGSNCGKRKQAAHVLPDRHRGRSHPGAELALGEGPGRIHVV